MTTKLLLRASGAALVVVVGGAATGVGAVSGASMPTCFGRRATIVSPSRDPKRQVEVRGTAGNDVIVGFAASDVITARGGNDLICSGGGDDYIVAGAGDDKIRGGPGTEDIWGGRGNDRIWAGRGVAEGLYGGPGHDRLFGGPGIDDYLFPGPGDDLVDGGPSHDLVMLVDATRGITADLRTGTITGQGRDKVVAVESVFGSEHDDVIYGDDNANTLAAGPGNDEVYGFGGDDRFRSGYGGDDLLDGGEGLNTASYMLGWDPVQADLVEGRATTSGVDTLIGITNLTGSRYDDVLIGDDQDNLIHGSLGDDVIDGGGGMDVAAYFDSFELSVDLVAGTAVDERGSDTLSNFESIIGSGAADSIVGDDGPNTFWGGRGSDTLVGAGGDDTLVGEGGADSAFGDSGVDTCDAETEIDCELDLMLSSSRGYGYGAWPPDALGRALTSRIWARVLARWGS